MLICKNEIHKPKIIFQADFSSKQKNQYQVLNFMRKTLLFIFLFSFISLGLWAQGDCDGCRDDDPAFAWNNHTTPPAPESSAPSYKETEKVSFAVYPNPAIDYINIEDETEIISEVIIYNLVGRKMKTFRKNTTNRYDISSLHKGLYLVQLLSREGEILTTMRVNKR